MWEGFPIFHDVIHQIATNNLTPGTSGNASERLVGRDVFRITPSGIGWATMGPDDWVAVSILTGQRVAGTHRPSTEWRVHQALYANHDWIGGIVHVHSLYATVLSTVGMPITAVHYQLARAGDTVPLLPYRTFGTPELAEAVQQAINDRTRAVLVANHGLFVADATVDGALQLCEEVEWTAMIQYHALTIGKPSALSSAALEEVRQAFRTYGQTPTL